MYPNPAGSIINITAGGNLQHIELYDVQGRLLQAHSENGSVTMFDISERAAGIYFIKIKTDKGVEIEKVIKE